MLSLISSQRIKSGRDDWLETRDNCQDSSCWTEWSAVAGLALHPNRANEVRRSFRMLLLVITRKVKRCWRNRFSSCCSLFDKSFLDQIKWTRLGKRTRRWLAVWRLRCSRSFFGMFLSSSLVTFVTDAPKRSTAVPNPRSRSASERSRRYRKVMWRPKGYRFQDC